MTTAMTPKTTTTMVGEAGRLQGQRRGVGESRAGLWAQEEEAGLCKEGGREWVGGWDDERAADIQQQQWVQHLFGCQHYTHACDR